MTRRSVGLAVGLCLITVAACSSGSTASTTSTRGSAPSTSTSAAPRRLSRVTVWGDSLSVQAAEQLRVEGRAHGLIMNVDAYVGLAPCDVARLVRESLANPPDALVLAFTGNNFSSCMQHAGVPLSGAAYFDAYRRDIEGLVLAATVHHVPVLIVGPPSFPASENHPDRVELNAMYDGIALNRATVRFVASGPAVSPSGFARQIACGEGETAALGCHGGLITVRSGNGIHFDEPRTVPCPSGRDVCHYTAGGHRYAEVMLAGLAKFTGLTYRPAPPTVGVPIVVTED